MNARAKAVAASFLWGLIVGILCVLTDTPVVTSLAYWGLLLSGIALVNVLIVGQR